MTPILGLVPPAPPPPGLLPLIEQRLGAEKRSRRMPRLRLAGTWLIGAATGAAAMLAMMPVGSVPGTDIALPLIVVDGADRVAMLRARMIGDGRYLRIDHFGLRIPIDGVLELWLLRDGSGRPESLGLLAAGTGATVLPIGRRILRGDMLAISEEPAGGASGPGPSGPVVLTARIANEI